MAILEIGFKGNAKNALDQLNNAIKQTDKSTESIKKSTNIFQGSLKNITAIVDTTKKDMAGLQNSIKGVSTIQSATTSSSKKLGTSISSLITTSQNASDGLKNLSGTFKTVSDATTKLSDATQKNTDGLKRLKMMTDGTVDSLKSLSKSEKSVRDDADSSSKKIKESSKSLEKLGDSADSSKSSLASMAKEFIAFETLKATLEQTTHDFMELEDAVLGVSKTTGLQGTALKELTDQLEKMSTTTAGFPIKDLYSIAESAGQLGIKGVDNIKKFTTEMQYMATSSKLTAEESATGFAQLANVLAVPISKVNHLTGAFTALASSTTATEGQLLDFTQRLSGAGKTLGLTNSQIIGIGATLKDVGIDAEVGGTAMSDLFSQMATNTKVFSKVAGESMDTFSQKVLNDPMKALRSFLGGLNNLDKVGKLQALKYAKLNSSGMSSVLLKLASNTKKLNENIATSKKAYEDGTATQKEYEISSKSLSNQLTMMQSEVKLLSADIGGSLKPTFVELAQSVTTATKYVRENKDSFALLGKGVIVATGAIALMNKAFISSPMGRTIALTTALATAVYTLADAYEKSRVAKLGDAIASQKKANAEFGNKLIARRTELLKEQTSLQASINTVSKNTIITQTAKEHALKLLGDRYVSVSNSVKRYNKELNKPKKVNVVEIKKGLDEVGKSTSVAVKKIKWVTPSLNNISSKKAVSHLKSTSKATKDASKALEKLREDAERAKHIDIQIKVASKKITETQGIQEEIELLKEKRLQSKSIVDSKELELEIVNKKNQIIAIQQEKAKKAEDERLKGIQEQQKEAKKVQKVETARAKAVQVYTDLLHKPSKETQLQRSIQKEIDTINDLRKAGNMPLLNASEMTKVSETFTEHVGKSLMENVADAFGVDTNKTLAEHLQGLGGVLNGVGGTIVQDVMKNGEVADGTVNNALMSSGNPYAMSGAVLLDGLNKAMSRPMDAFQKMDSNVGKENKGISNSLTMLNAVQSENLKNATAMRNSLESIDGNFNSLSISLANTGGISGEGYSGSTPQVKQNLGSVTKLADSLDFTGTGLIGGLVGGLFGSSKSEVTQSGIKFGQQTVASFLDGVNAQNFNVVKTTSKALFGAISSEKYSTKTSGLDEAVSKSFQEVMSNAKTLIIKAGVSIGDEKARLVKSIDSTKIDLGKLDFKDKTEAEIKSTLEGVFGKAIGDIAKNAVPQVEQFRHSGEDYLTALTRVSTGVESARNSLNAVGIKPINLDEVKDKNGKIFDNIVKDSIVRAETTAGEKMKLALNFNFDTKNFKKKLSGVGEIIKNTSLSGKDLIATYTTLIDAQKKMRQINTGGGELSKATISGAGSVETLVNSQKTFLDEFYSADEKRARLSDKVANEFKKAGIKSNVPTSKDEFKAIVSSVDLSTAVGQKQYGQLIAMTNEVLSLTDLTRQVDEAKKEADAKTKAEADKLAETQRKQLEELQKANKIALEAKLLKEKNTSLANVQLDNINKSGDITSTDIATAGGFETLKKEQQTLLDDFRSNQEKVADETEKLRKKFYALGIKTMPETREQLDHTIRTLDLSSQAGRKQYIGLLGLVDSFKMVTDPIKDAKTANEDFVASLKKNRDAYKGLKDTIQGTIDNIKGTTTKKGTTEDKFNQLVEYNKSQDAFNRELRKPTLDYEKLGTLFSSINTNATGLANNFSGDTGLTTTIVKQLEFNKRLAPPVKVQKVEFANDKISPLLDKISYISEQGATENVKIRKLLRDLLEEQERFNATQSV